MWSFDEEGFFLFSYPSDLFREGSKFDFPFEIYY